MKRTFTICLFMSLCLMACTKSAEEESAETKKPTDTKETEVSFTNITSCDIDSIQQLPWAQTLVQGKGPCHNIYSGASLIMYDYKGGKVFLFLNPADSLGICARSVYNCSGIQVITIFSEAKIWKDFETNRKNKKILWEKM